MVTKNDPKIAALVGFLIGICLVPTLHNLGVADLRVYFGVPFALAIIAFLGMHLARVLAERMAWIAQFARFLAVGFLNTAIDFGVLNLLSKAAGIFSGIAVGGVNIPGFGAAVINSYFWNKFWVFKDRDEGTHILKDFPAFLAVMVCGLLINSGIIILITTFVPPQFGLTSEGWLNIAKVIATGITLFWNFVGLKFLVFKR